MDAQRRHLLTLAAAAVGLTLGGPLLTAAGKMPSHLEAGDKTPDTLDRAEVALYRAGLGHMRPDTRPDDMHAVAAGVFRDVHALLKGADRAHRGRILYLESLAAAMVGSIYGHDRHWSLARPWFGHAKKAARLSADAGETRAPGAELVADALMAKVVLYMHPTQTKAAYDLAASAAGRAEHPHLGATYPAGAALPVSLVARAQAIRGDGDGAHRSLEAAARLIDDPAYFAAPYLDESVPVDGPLSLFGYGHRAHRFVECEVHAHAGDVPAARDAAAAYLHTPPGGSPASTTSTASVALLSARAVLTAGDPYGAADEAAAYLATLPRPAINPAVRARVTDLADDIARQVPASAHWEDGPVKRLSRFTNSNTGYLT